MIDYSDTTTNEQKPIKQSSKKPTVDLIMYSLRIQSIEYVVVISAEAGMFAVLILGLLCTCAVIHKKRRVKGKLIYN